MGVALTDAVALESLTPEQRELVLALLAAEAAAIQAHATLLEEAA